MRSTRKVGSGVFAVMVAAALGFAGHAGHPPSSKGGPFGARSSTRHEDGRVKQKIIKGVWSTGVLAGLVAGVLAGVSTPATAFAQEENACYRCECDELGCFCSLIACPDEEP